MKEVFEFIASILMTVITYLLGGWDSALQVLIICIVLDYLTGLSAGVRVKTLSSKIGIIGICKKVGILSIVCLSFMLDKIFGTDQAVRNLTIYFFVANEGISIIENATIVGLPIPKKLTELLAQLHEDSEGKTAKPKGNLTKKKG